MQRELTLSSVGDVTKSLVEALYELAVEGDAALAQGVIEAAARLLDELVSDEHASPFATQVGTLGDASKLLTQMITQQIECLRYIHAGNAEQVQSMLADHLVALRKLAAFLQEYLEQQGKAGTC